jgi:hypothetical protein
MLGMCPDGHGFSRDVGPVEMECMCAGLGDTGGDRSERALGAPAGARGRSLF